MSKQLGMILVVGGVLAIGGFYLYTNSKNKGAKSNKGNQTSGGATAIQFNQFISLATKAGSDLINRATATQINDLQNKWTKNLTSNDASTFLAIQSKPESSWTPSEQAQFGAIFTKWTGKVAMG